MTKVHASEAEMKEILRREMDRLGVKDNYLRAGLAAIIGGESNWQPKWELNYSHTSNDRIRRIFSKTRDLSDRELDKLKADERLWFNYLYGGRYGNTEPDDGYKYRGGGLIQHTFKDNYREDGKTIGVDLVNHPELIVDDPHVAAAAAVAYILRRYHGSGDDFDNMKKAVGNSIGEPDQVKNRLYAEYVASGEFDFAGTVIDRRADDDGLELALREYVRASGPLQDQLKAHGFLDKDSPTDFDFGPDSRTALLACFRLKGKRIRDYRA